MSDEKTNLHTAKYSRLAAGESQTAGREGKGAVQCTLCPNYCQILSGAAGICGMRGNIGGKLYANSYGKVSSIALDPIEKKPLRRFHPGKKILSIGSFGCNFHCPFCQNCEISMEYQPYFEKAAIMTPQEITELALQAIPKGNIGVAYTYNEPLIGYEFVYDCAKQVHQAGLDNILVTNGYINDEPLKALLPYIAAMNIDLKGFSDHFYKKLGGRLDAIKKIIELSQRHCHVEITTLIIPGENDSAEEIERLAAWIATINPEMPLHLTRFFPRYQYLDCEPTPWDIIYKLAEIAKLYLKNVY